MYSGLVAVTGSGVTSRSRVTDAGGNRLCHGTVTGNAAGGASGQGWASLGPGAVCGPDSHRPGPGPAAQNGQQKKLESRLLVR